MNAVSPWKEKKHPHSAVTTQIWTETPTEHKNDVIAENPSQCCLWTRPNPVGLDLEVSAQQGEVRVCIPAGIVIKTYCETAPGLNFTTNSQCICWIYCAQSKIWRDRNITQIPELRNAVIFRTRAPLHHSALFPPVLLSSCTQGLGPLHFVLCCQCLGQAIAHHPNQWLISASPLLQVRALPIPKYYRKGTESLHKCLKTGKYHLEPPKSSLQHLSGESAIPTVDHPRHRVVERSENQSLAHE